MKRHAVIIYNGRNCVRRLALSGVCHVMSARKMDAVVEKARFYMKAHFPN